MKITNLTNPGKAPIKGDILERDLPNGKKLKWGYGPAVVPEVVPVVVPRSVGSIIDLCQTVGGVSNAQLVTAYNKAVNEALWIKLSFAGELSKDDALAVELIDALTSPANVQAVVDAW